MPEDVSFDNLAIVLAAAFLAPLALGFVPRLRLPAVVFEIIVGIVIGPDVLAWAEADEPVRVLSIVGLAFLLFLAGLELDLDQLRGRLLRVASAGFVASLVLAAVAGFALDVGGFVKQPLLAAVILTATSLGLVIPVLKEGGHSDSRLGQLVIAGASIADFAAVILLSLLFSRDATSTGTRFALLVLFVIFVAVVCISFTRHARSMPLSRVLVRLQDTTAQIRVRGAMLLLGIFVVVAEQFGLETILGAFVAGALLSYADRDGARTHPQFRLKLEALGYGFLIPIFFVTSGITFDLSALLDEPSTLAKLPVFLGALFIVRGLPALVYRPLVGTRSTVAAALLQATSLPFIVAATQIGVAIDALTPATAAAFVGAGLLSALLFPIAALSLLRRCEATPSLEEATERGTDDADPRDADHGDGGMEGAGAPLPAGRGRPSP